MPYSLLLFDYDGTLCDTRQAIGHALRRTFQELDHPEPLPEVLEGVVHQGLPLAQTLGRFYPAGSTALPDNWLPVYRHLYATEAEPLVQPFAGALEVLAAATAQGAQIVVLSNKGLPILEDSLSRLGLRQYALLVLGDGSTNAAGERVALKPAPDLFTQLIQPRFPDHSLASTLMIGDTATDLKFARNCGIASCWASYGFGQEADSLAQNPTYIIQSLREVLPIIKENHQ
ncbi:HAD family hydrolase [Hymenobacter taeanensis]|uniref:phosphoglycolate phosphatase n=1 Tax=Hymenobacter taeanensis TaxID=2735321 RepID=A0A6M6BL21_9BACT|nr:MULTISPECIES: HAD family hydrolase [Hymenobacter]QJX48816.1 HAD family hydrolase [Hymenobacter taeanensis]UOQ81674.1 HAD family hydrolase [Hymenobacter sp. 5414T-23]